MHANLLIVPASTLAICLLFAPAARAQVEGCPEDNCVESETSIVYNPQTNQMDAFTTATTDYTTSYWYDLCVDLAVGRLNGPYLVNATNLIPSGNPWCAPAQTTMEKPGSVAASPGRQYYAVGLAQLRVYYEYWIVVPFPTCGAYCEGYWYDALGYSELISTQPSSAEWPSIVYTYPIVLVPVPVVYQEIAMAGSADTAWSPPVIYSVSPNQWPAGQATTFTISGDGFGYDPDLTISGAGIVSYTPKCASAPSPPCNTQIVATVTIDANTPGGMVETITVTANGLNPSGFLPVPIQGQSGQATAQATTQAFIPPVPQIWFNGSNIAGQTVAVYVGQRIPLTAVVSLPNGASPTSQSWNRVVQSSGLSGTVVAGYNPQQASGTVITLPVATPGTCQTLSESCLTFYWVDAGTWQWQYTYTYANQSRSAIATFNVLGPVTATPEITTQVGSAQALVNAGVPGMYLAGVQFQTGQVGILFQTPALPAPGNNGTYHWVQIVNSDQIRLRNQDGVLTCLSPAGFPALDNHYPYGTPGGSLFSVNRPNDTATDNPAINLTSTWGEAQRLFSATMYLMWDPTLPAGCTAATATNASTCTSIPVPLASVAWQFPGNAINTLQTQPPPNGTTWLVPCGPGQAGQCAAVAPGTDPRQSFPQWNKTFINGQYACN
ncbi:MAG: hypothetical protein IT161_24565 [Bryobacterales bacterium]|nr:hypothetical protein [Bryobacterales bacterium]